MLKRLFILFMLTLALTSCVKDDPVIVQTDSVNWKEKPDMSLISTTLTLYDGKNDPIEVTADQADFWTDESRAEIKGFSFIQNGEDGGVAMRGSADEASVDTETNVFVLRGNIILESVKEGLEIRAGETVTFNADTEEIEAPGEVHVLNEGSSFSGMGFYGNLRKEEYSFKKILEGKFDV